MRNLIAQINNPAVPATAASGNSGEIGATILARYIAVVIQTSYILAGLGVLLYFFMGAIGWITAGGDKSKIEAARNRIMQAAIGMVVLISVLAVAEFLSPLFGLDLLQPTFINQL